MVAHLQGEEGLGWCREKMSGKFGEGRQWAKRRPVRLIAENLCSPYCAEAVALAVISRMWTWWVSRSNSAPVRRSEAKSAVHLA